MVKCAFVCFYFCDEVIKNEGPQRIFIPFMRLREIVVFVTIAPLAQILSKKLKGSGPGEFGSGFVVTGGSRVIVKCVLSTFINE